MPRAEEAQLLLFSKTYRAYSAPEADEIFQSFSGSWQTQGRWTSAGEFSMRNGSEWPNAAVVCSLSQILEPDAPQKYFLSPKAARGILRRAEKRGKTLPAPLEHALQALANQK